MMPRTAHPLALRSTSAAVAALVTLLILDSPLASAGTGAPAARAKASATERARVRSRAHRAQLARSKPIAKPAAKAAIPAGAAGMRAVIDPATGRLTRPTAQDDAGLPTQGVTRRAATEDVSRTLPIERLPDGAELVRLDERFQEYEVARVGADGKVQFDCVHGAEGAVRHRAKDAQATPAPAPKREVR